jgi:hypothetical protein
LFFRLEIYDTVARHVETTAVSPAYQFDFVPSSQRRPIIIIITIIIIIIIIITTTTTTTTTLWPESASELF